MLEGRHEGVFCLALTAQEMSARPSSSTGGHLQTCNGVDCRMGEPRDGDPHFPDEETETKRGESLTQDGKAHGRLSHLGTTGSEERHVGTGWSSRRALWRARATSAPLCFVPQAHRGIKGVVMDKFGKPVKNARISVKGIRHDITTGELLPGPVSWLPVPQALAVSPRSSRWLHSSSSAWLGGREPGAASPQAESPAASGPGDSVLGSSDSQCLLHVHQEITVLGRSLLLKDYRRETPPVHVCSCPRVHIPLMSWYVQCGLWLPFLGDFTTDLKITIDCDVVTWSRGGRDEGWGSSVKASERRWCLHRALRHE